MYSICFDFPKYQKSVTYPETQRYTDRQTDRQTDRRTDRLPYRDKLSEPKKSLSFFVILESPRLAWDVNNLRCHSKIPDSPFLSRRRDRPFCPPFGCPDPGIRVLGIRIQNLVIRAEFRGAKSGVHGGRMAGDRESRRRRRRLLLLRYRALKAAEDRVADDSKIHGDSCGATQVP